MSRNRAYPYCTLFVCLMTFCYSVYVAFAVTGQLWGTVKIVDLEPYGGVTLTHLQHFELWRLFAAQLIHVKPMHMLYNVVSLALLGSLLEWRLGALKFFGLWFVSGAVGTLVSTLGEPAPWNLGTGASQAVLGIAGLGLALFLGCTPKDKGLGCVLAWTLFPPFVLDFVHVGYPKLGHVIPAVLGMAVGILCLKTKKWV